MIKAVNRVLAEVKARNLPKDVPHIPSAIAALPGGQAWGESMKAWWYSTRKILQEIEEASTAQAVDDTSWIDQIAGIKVRLTAAESQLVDLSNGLDGLDGITDRVTALESTVSYLQDLITVIQIRLNQLEGVIDSYVHEQTSAAATWTITHPIGRRVNVIVLDENNERMITGESQPDESTVIIEMNGARTGKAILS